MDDDRGSRRRSRRRFLAGVGTGLVASLAGCSAVPDADGTASTTTPAGSVDAGQGPDSQKEGVYTRVYRQTIDSVVFVRVFTGAGTSSQGSGFVYDDTRVVTNEHVVAGAKHIEVRFANGEWREAEVVGTDVYSDLAAVEIPDTPAAATPLELVTADPPIGTRVVALGNPFGFGESVSAGIVSGVNRALPAANDFVIPDAIQTDAAVNPGNSGGPLVNLDGDVVGVINSGGGDNLGFAISYALVERVIPALIERGTYEHPYMGVRLLTVTPTIADANDLSEPDGVLVTSVLEGGPSDGVLRGSPDETELRNQLVPVGGDVIRRMGDDRIHTQPDLANYLALNTRPGDTIPVEVVRDGDRTTVDLTLGTRPAP